MIHNSAADAGSPEAERREAVWELKDIFETLGKQKPTLDNLLKVMRDEGSEPSLVTFAVDIFAAEYSSRPDFVTTINGCFERHGRTGTVAYSCGSALKEAAPAKARAIWASVVDNHNTDASMRLLSAEGLLELGDLRGHAAVQAGLRSRDPNDYKTAKELLEKYIAHDGEEAAGKRIDAKAMIDQAEPFLDKETAQKVRKELHQKRGNR